MEYVKKKKKKKEKCGKLHFIWMLSLFVFRIFHSAKMRNRSGNETERVTSEIENNFTLENCVKICLTESAFFFLSNVKGLFIQLVTL